jgi:hypothetical protein
VPFLLVSADGFVAGPFSVALPSELFAESLGSASPSGALSGVSLASSLGAERLAKYGDWRDPGDCLFSQALIGEAADLRHLVRPDLVLHHQPSGGVGAVRRQLPVSVGATAV